MLGFFERFFHLQESKTNLKTELLAGITTFSTLAYAIVLVPCTLQQVGMDGGAVMTAMLLAAAFGTLLMGLLANYPFVAAPGMTLVIFFVYSVVLGAGFTWQQALGVTFVCAIALIVLTLLGVRQKVVEALPQALRLATTAGLGLLLAFVGLRSIGIVVSHPATCVMFGNPKNVGVLLTLIGLLISGGLMAFRVPGALFLGIITTWLIGLGVQATAFQGFISMPPSLVPTFNALDFSGIVSFDGIAIFVSMLFMSLFDSTGTLIGLAEEGHFLKEHGNSYKFPRAFRALLPDATASMLGAYLGVSTTAIYLESASGIAVGGRTGLTSVVVGLLLLLALFFSPFASSIPPFATAPVLILIGGGMLKMLGGLKWEDPSEWIPAFVTLILIPLTSSATIGLGAGFVVYPLLKFITGKRQEVSWVTWALCLLFALKFILLPPI